jgi:hypothetical protein
MPPPAIAAISLAPLPQATCRKPLVASHWSQAIVTCPAYEPVNLGINSTGEKNGARH